MIFFSKTMKNQKRKWKQFSYNNVLIFKRKKNSWYVLSIFVWWMKTKTTTKTRRTYFTEHQKHLSTIDQFDDFGWSVN